MKPNFTRKVILLFVFLIIFMVSCSQQSDTVNTPQGDSDIGNEQENTQESATETTTVEDKLAKYDFEEKEIRILTSINESDGVVSNSNYMIEGSGEVTGEAVNDAVYKRNTDVENLLNVKLVYSQMNEDYGSVQSIISKLILSGTDQYDLIINDLRSLVNLSLKGMFLDIKQTDVFDLTQSYWYSKFMEDVSIGKDKTYILAGDYFADILRNCHALFLNKSMLDEKTPGATDELYQKVLDGQWTFDEFLSLTKSFLQDVNGDGAYNKEDQYGFICVGTWGSALPFMMAADTNIFTKDADGIPSLTMNNPKSIKLHEYLLELFTTNSGGNSSFDVGELISEFQKRRSLMVGYQRLCTLQSLRDMQDEISILPYPKLNIEQPNYVTSAHDTIEVGAIPSTSPNFAMTCVALEALNRETKNTVIPVYYEQSLKIKYARDDISGQLIDLIHDGMDNVFPLAYSEVINGLLSLYDVGATKNFISSYEKVSAKAEIKLDKVIEQYFDAAN